jgi:hypothetical protein
LKNIARNERLTLDTAVGRVTDNDIGDHDSIPTDPEILACVKSSRRVLVPVQPPTAGVSATTFLRKGCGSKYSCWGMKLTTHLHPMTLSKEGETSTPSPYVLTSFYARKRKIYCKSSFLTGKLAVRIKFL